jgi:hypothetical protein
VIVATVVGPGCALDEFVEDIFANEVCPPLALAVEHRSVQQFAGYIDVVVGLPYPADLLHWSGEVFLGESPGVLATDFFERAAHEFVELGRDLMAPNLSAEALGDTGKVRLHETVPECDERIGNEVAAVALLRAGVHRLDDADQPHALELPQVGAQCSGVAELSDSADDFSVLGTPCGYGGQDAGILRDFSQFGLQQYDWLIDQAAGLRQ